MIVYGLHLRDKIDGSCPSRLSHPTASVRTSPPPSNPLRGPRPSRLTLASGAPQGALTQVSRL